jgi:hypothetical protein
MAVEEVSKTVRARCEMMLEEVNYLSNEAKALRWC